MVMQTIKKTYRVVFIYKDKSIKKSEWASLFIFLKAYCGASNFGLSFGSSRALPAGLFWASSSVKISSSSSTFPFIDVYHFYYLKENKLENSKFFTAISPLASRIHGHHPLRRFCSNNDTSSCLCWSGLIWWSCLCRPSLNSIWPGSWWSPHLKRIYKYY